MSEANLAVRPFEEARAFVRSLGLRTRLEYTRWAHGLTPTISPRPEDIPISPHVHPEYAVHWSGWTDWLGGYKRDRRRGSYNSFKRRYAPSAPRVSAELCADGVSINIRVLNSFGEIPVELARDIHAALGAILQRLPARTAQEAEATSVHTPPL